MLLDKVEIELKINPPWYNPLLDALERKRTPIHKKVTKLKGGKRYSLK